MIRKLGLLKIALGTLGCWLILSSASALGAERIVFHYGILEFYLSISDLEVYANEGIISSKFTPYLKRLDPQQTWLRNLLSTPYNSEGDRVETIIQLNRLLKSVEGEIILELFGEVIQTESRSQVDAAKAIRSSIILAAADSSNFTALEVLRHFPMTSIMVDLTKVSELNSKLRRLGQLIVSLRQSEVASEWLREVPDFVDTLVKLTANEKERMDEADSIIRQAFLEWLIGSLNVETDVISRFNRSLEIRRANNDLLGEGLTLLGLGWYYTYIGKPHEAIKRTERALDIFQKEVDFDAGKALTLTSIGFAYFQLDRDETALKFYQKAQEIYQERESNKRRLSAENFIKEFFKVAVLDFSPPQIVQLIYQYAGEGILYQCLGAVSEDQYEKAMDYYERALAIHRKTNFLDLEQWQLGYLAGYHRRLGKHEEALRYAELSQELEEERRRGKGITIQISKRKKPSLNTAMFGDAHFSNIVGIYIEQHEYEKAERYLKEKLNDLRSKYQSPSPRKLGYLYRGLGLLYLRQDEYSKALEYYQQALSAFQILSDTEEEAWTLYYIGYVLQVQGQPEVAVVFYKQSVNNFEGVRYRSKKLPYEVQEAYTETVAGVYRQLANLLLQQDRIYEAQQVLELLKLQEIQDFTRSQRVKREIPEVVMLSQEKKIIRSYYHVVAFAAEIDQCEKTECPELSELRDQLEDLKREYNNDVRDWKDTIIRQRDYEDDQFLDPNFFNDTANRIIQASDAYNTPSGTAVIYPLVLEDKLWLLWAAKGKVIGKRGITHVGRQQLNQEVLKLRNLLQNPNSDVTELQKTAQQLYDWLIRPIEEELEAGNIHHLAFSLDRGVRYIPMAVLYDGDQYLIEKYSVATFTSSNERLTDTQDRLPQKQEETPILGVGASEAPGYDPLPHVVTEINGIVRENRPDDQQGIYPGNQFLDETFTFRTLRDNLKGRKLLHIATHGDFVPGDQYLSYLVLGDGKKLSIPDIQILDDYLDDVHLVVLSACETALGDSLLTDLKQEEGIEINALSFYFLIGGAKTVIASLWRVDDTSTSQLMQRFYCILANETPSITKAEALRKAQLSLLKNTPLDCEQSTSDNSDFTHPHYWAPFILIGNGL